MHVVDHNVFAKGRMVHTSFCSVYMCDHDVNADAASAYRRHDQAKKREYGQRVRGVERGVFTPLFLAISGGTGREAQTLCRYDIPEKNKNNTPVQ